MNIRTVLKLPVPLSLCAGACLAASTAYGQGGDEIVVIGQRLEETLPQQLERLGNRLSTVDRATLDLGGFNDVTQALQMEAPNFYVAPFSGPFDYIHCSLQGGRCQDILFLIDGVRIANRLYDTTMPLDTIPSHSIERIEVLHGGQGLFYGTQSASGVVNIVTRSFRGEPTGQVEMGADDNSGTHLSANYMTGSGDHSIVVFASRDEADGFQSFRTSDYEASAVDRERGYEVFNLGAKYGYDLSDDSRITVLYQHTDNELDYLLPMQVVTRFNERDEDLLTFKWDYAFGNDGEFYVKAYYHDWDTHWTDTRNTLTGGVVTGQSTLFQDAFWGFKDYGVTALASVTSGNVEYSAGYDYQRFWGSDEVWLIEDKTETAQAVYGQIRSSAEAFENSDISFGVRYNTTSGSADGTVWTLTGRHDLTDSLYLRGQVGTSFRLPDAEELWLRDCCEVGNPNLDAEESENFEVGLGGGSGRFGWQAIYFQRDLDKLIGIDFDNPAFPDGIFTNFSETVEFDGVEIALNAMLAESVTGTFSYSMTDASFEGSSLQYNRVPEDFMKLGVGYRPSMGPFELNVSILSVGEVFDVPHSSLGRVAYGDYTVADVSAGFYLDPDRRHRIGVRLENAFDEEYTTALVVGRRDSNNARYTAGYVGPPRTINATYSYRW